MHFGGLWRKLDRSGPRDRFLISVCAQYAIWSPNLICTLVWKPIRYWHTLNQVHYSSFLMLHRRLDTAPQATWLAPQATWWCAIGDLMVRHMRLDVAPQATWYCAIGDLILRHRRLNIAPQATWCCATGDLILRHMRLDCAPQATWWCASSNSNCSTLATWSKFICRIKVINN